MNLNLLRDSLELIIARSTTSADDAIVGLFAIQRQVPLPGDRYGQILDNALSDKSANWTEAERTALLISWAEVIDHTTKRAHLVRLTDNDWALALSLGKGNASLGIRTAIRHLKLTLDQVAV